MVAASNAELTSLLFDEQGSNPATPASTFWRLYCKADGLYVIDDAGVVLRVSGGAEVDYIEKTSNTSVTATVEASGDTVVTGSAITYDGSTAVLVEFFSPAVRPNASSNAAIVVSLFDNGTTLGWIAYVSTGDTVNTYVPVHAIRRLTPSAAAHTFSVRAYVTTGTGQVSAGSGGSGAFLPGYIRITRA